MIPPFLTRTFAALWVLSLLLGCRPSVQEAQVLGGNHRFKPTEGEVISSALAHDFDGDGTYEIAIGSWDGYFYLLDSQLNDLPGWPQYSPKGFFSSPALADSIASQIWYYSGRPAYTAWPQYRMWDIPPLQDVTVVSLDYLPEGLVTARLVQAFEKVRDPRELRYEERGTIKEARVWQAEELKLDDEAFLQQFDFLMLLEAAR